MPLIYQFRQSCDEKTAAPARMGASQSELAAFPDPGPAVTPERILAALRNHEARQDVELTQLKDSAGNVKGEGFMSSLARVRQKSTVQPLLMCG